MQLAELWNRPLWSVRVSEWLVLFFLAAGLLSIYAAPDWRGLLLLAALIVTWRQRRLITVDPGIKRVALLVLAYILLFTILSTEWGRSAKGAYDMMRGMLVFFVAYLLGMKLGDPRQFLAFTISVVVLILSSFLVPWDYEAGFRFYGFHENPNNSAVALVVYTVLAIPLLADRRHTTHWLIGCLGLLAGTYLVMLTNSRGAWLGLFGAALVILFMQSWIRLRYRLAIAGLLAFALYGAVIFANVKGTSLSLRDEIWLGLFWETVDQRLWLGFGLNRAKDVMMELSLPTLTAHNFFLEVFVSSGVAGLVFVLGIIAALLRHLLSFDYRRSAQFYMGAGGLVAYMIMAQFDLKLSSFIFMATLALFLGLLYSQRLPRSAP